MQQLEFGWFMHAAEVPNQPQVPLLVAEEPAVLPVVAEHFDSIWVNDHFWAFTDPAHAWIEGWTALVWLAARYPRLRVGPIVLGVGYRNPALLAKMAATLQTLSAGRFIMGIGAGWRDPEYTAYGYPFPPAATRIAQLEEAVQIMRLMWTTSAPSFQGRYYQIAGAWCEPRPTPPPPIMIGGGGPQRTLPLVGRQADIWDRWYGTPPEAADLPDYQAKRDIVHQHAAAAGRDPASIVLSVTMEELHLPETAGDTARFRERLRPLLDLGVRQFILGFGHVADADLVRRLAGEVLDPLRAEYPAS